MKNKVVIALLTLVLIAGLGAGAVFLGTRGVTTPAANSVDAAEISVETETETPKKSRPYRLMIIKLKRQQRELKKRRPPKKRLPRK